MASTPVASTIGRPLGAISSFLRWSEAEALAPQARALVEVLLVRTGQGDLLSVVLHRLARSAAILESWADDGAELFGLAQLARGLRDSPAFLASLPGRNLPPAGKILGEFHGQVSSHYLYIAWSVRNPPSVLAGDWLDIVRAWLLIKNLSRAAMFSSVDSDAGLSPVHDLLIQEAASKLRMACEETVGVLTPTEN